MPDLGIKLHYWWPEGVVIRYPNIDGVGSPVIRCTGGTLERALEMCKIISITNRAGGDVRDGVCMYIGNFFGDTTSTTRRHGAVEGQASQDGLEVTPALTTDGTNKIKMMFSIELYPKNRTVEQV